MLIVHTVLVLALSVLVLDPVLPEVVGVPDPAAVWVVVLLAPALVDLALHAVVFVVADRRAAADSTTHRNT